MFVGRWDWPRMWGWSRRPPGPAGERRGDVQVLDAPGQLVDVGGDAVDDRPDPRQVDGDDGSPAFGHRTGRLARRPRPGAFVQADCVCSTDPGGSVSRSSGREGVPLAEDPGLGQRAWLLSSDAQVVPPIARGRRRPADAAAGCPAQRGARWRRRIPGTWPSPRPFGHTARRPPPARRVGRGGRDDPRRMTGPRNGHVAGTVGREMSQGGEPVPGGGIQAAPQPLDAHHVITA